MNDNVIGAQDLMNHAINAINSGDVTSMDAITSYISSMGNRTSDYLDIWDMVEKAREKTFYEPAQKRGLLSTPRK